MLKILRKVIYKRKIILLIMISICVLFIYFNSIIRLFHVEFDTLFNQSSTLHCSKYFEWNMSKSVLKKAEDWQFPTNEAFSDSQMYQRILNNCSSFLSYQKYFFTPPSNEERKFKIAFSLISFKSASQVERLLRMIYRPWNYYCIHIDKKSSNDFSSAIEELVKCINLKSNNTINTKNRVEVEWGTMSVLTAELNCMKELYENFKDWKYFINLSGQEFPLKTNAELVKILKAFKGANNVEGYYKDRRNDRIPNAKIPFPIIWYTGSVHITVNHDFVSFVLKSPQSKILLDSLKNQFIPEESYFSTLNYNSILRIPGSFVGSPDENQYHDGKSGGFITRFKNSGQYSCESKYIIRQICIWGVGDLPKLTSVPNLFAHKFREDFQPATLRCLEKWYYEKVEKEIWTGRTSVNTAFYSSLPFVKYRFIP